MKTYLGIDGGGSKTRALLMDEEGRRIHYAESGPSNLNAYDQGTVRTSLIVAIQACIEASGSMPSATCCGMAGGGSPAIKTRLESILSTTGLAKPIILTDAEIAIEGAFAGESGILLIAGTGSICFAKSSTGTIHRTGGWGWLADDAGSAGWIGREALKAAVQQNDGRIPGHMLRDKVFAALGISSEDEISSKLYQPPLKASQLADLASGVIELAEKEDKTASAICATAIFELEKLVRSTSAKMTEGTRALVFSGGLLEHHSGLRDKLCARLPEFEIKAPRSTAVEGAVALARKSTI